MRFGRLALRILKRITRPIVVRRGRAGPRATAPARRRPRISLRRLTCTCPCGACRPSCGTRSGPRSAARRTPAGLAGRGRAASSTLRRCRCGNASEVEAQPPAERASAGRRRRRSPRRCGCPGRRARRGRIVGAGVVAVRRRRRRRRGRGRRRPAPTPRTRCRRRDAAGATPPPPGTPRGPPSPGGGQLDALAARHRVGLVDASRRRPRRRRSRPRRRPRRARRSGRRRRGPRAVSAPSPPVRMSSLSVPTHGLDARARWRRNRAARRPRRRSSEIDMPCDLAGQVEHDRRRPPPSDEVARAEAR